MQLVLNWSNHLHPPLSFYLAPTLSFLTSLVSPSLSHSLPLSFLLPPSLQPSLPPVPGLAGLQCLFQSFRWGQIRHIRYLIQFIVIQSCCAPGGHQKEGPWVLEPDRPHAHSREHRKAGRTVVKCFDLTNLLTLLSWFNVLFVLFVFILKWLLKVFVMTHYQYLSQNFQLQQNMSITVSQKHSILSVILKWH